ncbi:MAG TPA: holo-ACP synthase [Acidimicrobiales bacterium]|nr:holo-ACP synthase [Acidimicrobiales bacterium]
MAPALIGLGLDSVDIGRFAEVLARRPVLRERLFTAAEQAYADTLSNPVPTLAGRFAVKEAVMKCLGVGLGAFDWGDVDVRRAASGRPLLTVSGRAAGLAAEQGVDGWQLSITHTATVASAVVAALGTRGNEAGVASPPDGEVTL